MNDSILIVDDSLTVRMDLAEVIGEAGFNAIPCEDAAQARAALAREPVALIILDVLLPDTDGIELLREIRSHSATALTPVLMLSTEAEVTSRIHGLQMGATEYVGKPYDTGYLVARVRELLQREQNESVPPHATILIIDDSVTFCEALGAALNSTGYAVLIADSGEQGLRIAAASRPSAIIVDRNLPGIDGATVIRKIRLDGALRGTPCILLTASEERSAELQALDSGADAFVRKEEDMGVILARLAAVLRSATTTGRSDTASLLDPKRILAVDDSVTYLYELSSVLNGEGYDVVLARSGEEAMKMLDAQPIDCILLDLVMPGQGGEETCRQIKESLSFRDIPLIMLTAVEGREAMINALQLGADDFIQKSSEFEVLKARVRAQIRRKQFEDDTRSMREELLRREMEAVEAKAAQRLAEAKAAYADELENKNKELEAFSYSVSHDLRAPLRAIDGFSRALEEEYQEKFDQTGIDYLKRVRSSARRMGELIDDLLQLSQINRADIRYEQTDLSAIASQILEELQRNDPNRQVNWDIENGLYVNADRRLMRVVLENLLSNAWKYSSKRSDAIVKFSTERLREELCYVICDNGAGFDMAYVHKLFNPFQRLHSESEFPGTGIGLAIVQRVILRHGGRIWAESELGQGARIYFTLAGK